MLKCAGILFILTGAFGFGGYMDACLKWHLDQLIGCREIFAQINAYRVYLKLPYGELIRRSAIGKSGVLPEILTEVAVEMGKNREANVGALWEEAFFKRKKQLYLKEEEIGILLALAKCLALEGNHAHLFYAVGRYHTAGDGRKKRQAETVPGNQCLRRPVPCSFAAVKEKQ